MCIHIACASRVLSLFLVLSQEEKLNGLTKELEKTTFDMDSFEKKYQMAEKETERVRSELAHSQAE